MGVEIIKYREWWTIQEICDYYDTSKKCIDTLVMRNKGLLENYRIKLIGNELKEFKNKNKGRQPNKTTSLVCYTQEGFYLIGMLLSPVNNRIREIKSYIAINKPQIYKEYYTNHDNTGYVKRYENDMDELLNRLFSKRIKIDKQVACGKYRIDFVLNNKIAIEVDENGHSSYDSENEKKREKKILDKGYILKRVNPMKDDYLGFIGDIIPLLNIT